MSVSIYLNSVFLFIYKFVEVEIEIEGFASEYGFGYGKKNDKCIDTWQTQDNRK